MIVFSQKLFVSLSTKPHSIPTSKPCSEEQIMLVRNDLTNYAPQKIVVHNPCVLLTEYSTGKDNSRVMCASVLLVRF